MNSSDQRIAIMITKAGMGHADDPLQQKLINTYLNMVLNQDPLPVAICLYTEGVYLATADSTVLGVLETLEKRGVHIVLCSTCVDFYDLREHVGVGVIGGMHDILEVQWRADKVITL